MGPVFPLYPIVCSAGFVIVEYIRVRSEWFVCISILLYIIVYDRSLWPGTKHQALAHPHYEFIISKMLVWWFTSRSSRVIIAYLSLKWLYKWFTSVFKTPLMCFSFADANKSRLVILFTTSLSVSGWPRCCWSSAVPHSLVLCGVVCITPRALSDLMGGRLSICESVKQMVEVEHSKAAPQAHSHHSSLSNNGMKHEQRNRKRRGRIKKQCNITVQLYGVLFRQIFVPFMLLNLNWIKM